MITVRDPELDLSAVPRHWFDGHVACTGFVNAVSMLFPWGERFFVRSVYAYKSVWADDPVLAARVRGFAGQEGRHAHVHDAMNALLRAQGYSIDRFLDWYASDSARWEARISPALRLATTAAAEHFTAILAENALSGDDGLLAKAHPEVAALLGWHAVEEIEHRSVAFDVLQRVDSSYALRVAGLALATMLLGKYWAVGARVLWRQDGLTVRAALRQLRGMQRDYPLLRRVFLRGIREYVRPDFHPDRRDLDSLARAWLERNGQRFATGDAA